jgi:hypothetical protein
VVQQAVEPKGTPMKNTIPETDSVGLKSLKCYHGATGDDGTDEEVQIRESETQESWLKTGSMNDSVTTNDTVQPAVEAKGAPMNNTIPVTDGVGFKSLQSYHGAVTDVGTGVTTETRTQQIQVFVRLGREMIEFEVTGEEELKMKVEKQRKLQTNQYLIHPRFDVQKSGTGYTVTLKVCGRKLNPMQDLRRRFGYWHKEDRGSQFCRFWYRDQVCDAYLDNWTTNDLIAQIQAEDPEADPELKVWRKGELLEGPFEWEDIGLSISNEPPEDDEFPDLWRWEVEIDAMAESALMRVSPVHPLADTLRGVEALWGVGHYHEWVVWGPAGPMVEAEC